MEVTRRGEDVSTAVELSG